MSDKRFRCWKLILSDCNQQEQAKIFIEKVNSYALVAWHAGKFNNANFELIAQFRNAVRKNTLQAQLKCQAEILSNEDKKIQLKKCRNKAFQSQNLNVIKYYEKHTTKQYKYEKKNIKIVGVRAIGAKKMLEAPGQFQLSLFEYRSAKQYEKDLNDEQFEKNIGKRIDQLKTTWFSQTKGHYLTLHFKKNQKKRHYAFISEAGYGKTTFFERIPQYAYFWDYQQKFQDTYVGQQIIVFDCWRIQKHGNVPWGVIEHLTSDDPKIPKKHCKAYEPGRLNVIILTNLNDPFKVYEQLYDQHGNRSDIINQRFTIANFNSEQLKIKRPQGYDANEQDDSM